MINPNLTPKKKIYEKESGGGALPIVALPKLDLPNVSEGSESSATNNNAPSLNLTYNPYSGTTEGLAKKQAADDALAALNGLGEHKYANEQIYQDWLNKKLNREDFSYDLNADALYNQYRDQYIQQGKLAMEDTMGQAVALTGGYGNSYAATVGNQVYQAYLGKLNDIIPELYQMALQKYTMEGDRIDSNLAALGEDYNKSLGEWKNKYGMLMDEYNIANSDFFNSATLYNSEQDSLNDIALKKAQWDEGIRQSKLEQYWKEKAYEESKVASSNDNISVQVPDSIRNKLDSMTSNTEVEAYLENLEATGAISHDTALQLMAEYMDSNEVYKDNEDGSQSISYSSMTETAKGWTVKDNGGMNFVGIDENAKVQTPNGEIITLKNLKEKLMAEGMSSSEARNAIKKLQQNLGISSNWFFGL